MQGAHTGWEACQEGRPHHRLRMANMSKTSGTSGRSEIGGECKMCWIMETIGYTLMCLQGRCWQPTKTMEKKPTRMSMTASRAWCKVVHEDVTDGRARWNAESCKISYRWLILGRREMAGKQNEIEKTLIDIKVRESLAQKRTLGITIWCPKTCQESP